MWSSLPCFFTFCCSAIPTSCYIFNVFLLLVYVIFLAAGTCLSWGLPSHSCRSLSPQGSIYGPLTQVLATLAVLAEESLIQASVQTLSQTLLWMDDKASSPCLKTWGTHRSRHSKSIDNTSLTLSFILSDTFILMDLPQSFQMPCSTTHAPILQFHAQVVLGTNSHCISNSAILSNNFVSLLSDL